MDIIKGFLSFFTDRDYSITSKFLFVIILIGAIIFVDNILGFSFYYVNEQKIEQLERIEHLKKNSKNNKSLIRLLEETENKIIERKNVIDIFLELFSRDQLEKVPISKIEVFDSTQISIKDSSIKYTDSIQIKPEEQLLTKKENNYRSRLWHTISSSYLLILIMLILPISGIIQRPFHWSNFIGMLFVTGFIAGIVWLNQYLLGLIPVVFNMPWINYILNFIIHTTIFIWFGLATQKK